MPRPLRSLLWISCLLLLLPIAAGAQCDPKSEFDCTEFLRMSSQDFDRLLERLHRFPGLERLDNRRDLCQVLLRGRAGSECDQARREYLMLALNLATGRIDRGCCYDWAGETWGAREGVEELGNLIRNGSCAKALRRASDANAGNHLRLCRRDPGDDSGDGDDDNAPGRRRASACSPDTQGPWRQRCRSDDAELRRYSDRVRPTRALPDANDVGDLCEVLETPKGGVCGAARAQLATALLNLASGRLQPGCEVRSVGQNRDHETVGEAVREADRRIAAGDCAGVNGILAPINSGGHLEDGGGDDGEDASGRPGRGPKKDKGNQGKGRGKGKGKGRP